MSISEAGLRMKLAVALIATTIVMPVHAMPDLTPEGCYLVADTAVVARALAQEGVDQQVALKALERIYPDAMQPYHREIVAGAYGKGEKRNAKQYAAQLYKHCLTNNGKLEGFLGSPS